MAGSALAVRCQSRCVRELLITAVRQEALTSFRWQRLMTCGCSVGSFYAMAGLKAPESEGPVHPVSMPGRRTRSHMDAQTLAPPSPTRGCRSRLSAVRGRVSFRVCGGDPEEQHRWIAAEGWISAGRWRAGFP